MPWVEAREEQSASVGAREDSEVKLRRREQPFAARLRAMASPIPATVLVDSLLCGGGAHTPRSAGDDAEFAFQNAGHFDIVQEIGLSIRGKNRIEEELSKN
jgi:hypothetical protein